MSSHQPPPRSTPDEAAAREAAMAEWEQSAQPAPRRGSWPKRDAWRAEADPGEGDVDGYVAPPKRAAFPPSFLLLWAVGFAFLALEPTADLRYQLFGPSSAVDLGSPGEHRIKLAQDGARVKISALSYNERGTFSQFGSDYEVLALMNVPVIVQRSPQPRPPPSTTELYRGEGRLLRIDGSEGNFIERMLRPAARYSAVRQQFQALGQLPLSGAAWILVEGDLPRSHPAAFLVPLGLWLASLFFAFHAWRSYRLRQQPVRSRTLT